MVAFRVRGVATAQEQGWGVQTGAHEASGGGGGPEGSKLGAVHYSPTLLSGEPEF